MRALLMGGQACIAYGAAEFSRDVDLAIAVDSGNLRRLALALEDLRAEPVLFPALTPEALLRGHACHFRCRPPGGRAVRLDVMTVMRGAEPFEALWSRRRRLRIPGVGQVWLMSREDLVQVKKTQRDKDWPMVRALVDVDVAGRTPRPARSRVRFWLRECRTAATLVDLARRYRGEARRLAQSRPALRHALAGNVARIARALRAEEDRERAADFAYWAPLRAELERWRLTRARTWRRRT